MNPSLLHASWTAVRRAGLLAPAAGAVGLAAATAPLLDDGYGVQVLRGVGVLLACAWVSTMDDPMGEVTAASPYPRSLRSLARAAAGMAVLLTVWVACAALVETRAEGVPVLSLGLQALALGVAGVSIAAALRAWGGHHQPSYLAVPGLVVLAVAIDILPRGWDMMPSQMWGPPWEAAQIRWGALLLLGVAVLALALADPLTGPSRHGQVGRSGVVARGRGALRTPGRGGSARRC